MPTQEPVTLSARKRLVFGLATAALALGLFELGARLVMGDPPPSDMVARISQCRVTSVDDTGWLDCQPGNMEDVSAPLAPDPERPRVVFLGGSSVRESHVKGRPTFAAAVAERLPGIEVLNFGATGMTVANVARLSSELELLQPDLVVIYSGHNDYNGDVFRGSIQGTRLWMVPVHRFLEKSWLHGLLARRAQGISRDDRPKARVMTVDDGLALELRSDIDARYAHDLELAVTESPAPVVLCTLLRNPDYPPSGVYAPDHPDCPDRLPGLEGPTTQHAQRVEQSEAACGEASITWWNRARAHAARGDDAAAVEAWYASLDADALPIRAPHSADPIVRAVAERTGARLVDLEQTLGPLAEPALFTDTLHFSAAGTEAIADVLAPVIADELGL